MQSDRNRAAFVHVRSRYTLCAPAVELLTANQSFTYRAMRCARFPARSQHGEA